MGTEEFEVECFDQIDDGYEEMKHNELVQRLAAEWGEMGKQLVDDCFREGSQGNAAYTVGGYKLDRRGWQITTKVGLYNMGREPHEVRQGDRIAQLVIVPVWYLEPKLVDSLPDSERGTDGYGSTGR